jgi:prevent-host-death family protein
MQVNIYAAKTQLSRLVDRASAGEEVVITRHGRPIARLVPVGPAKPARKLGLLEGQGYWIADDFDAPLPDDLLDLFEGKTSS